MDYYAAKETPDKHGLSQRHPRGQRASSKPLLCSSSLLKGGIRKHQNMTLEQMKHGTFKTRLAFFKKTNTDITQTEQGERGGPRKGADMGEGGWVSQAMRRLLWQWWRVGAERLG